MKPDTRFDRDLDAALGALQSKVGGAARDFSRYRGRLVDFCVDVLGMRLLRWQRRWLRRFSFFRQHILVGCNASGKTALLRAVLIYVATVLAGTSVYLSASEKQTRSQAVARLRSMVERAKIPTEIHLHGGVFPGGGTIVFLAAGADVSLGGGHDEDMVIVADEASALESSQVAALQGSAIGERNRLVLSGNALSCGTPFHRVAMGVDPSWNRTTVDAYQILNDPASAFIGGLVSAQGVNDIRQTWGESSPEFQTRIWARFPTQRSDAMFREGDIQAAFARWSDPAFVENERRKRLTFALDVAASGPDSDGDESVLARVRGNWVEDVAAWMLKDTMETVERVGELLGKAGVAKRRISARGEIKLLQMGAFGAALMGAPPSGDPIARGYGGVGAQVFVDSIGAGLGVCDRLREQGWPARHWNSSWKAPDAAAQLNFVNIRAWAFDRVRTLMVKGEIGLPWSAELEADLRSARGFANPKGLWQVIDKAQWKAENGNRSPDRLDAIVIALAGSAGIDWASLPDMSGVAF